MKLQPDKDQHLLINKEILAREIEVSNLTKEDKVIEIGAGTGILTSELVKKTGKVLAFEIDEKFRNNLEKLTTNKNLTIIYDNALNYDWKGYNKIVSNIPYSLSEPIIQKSINSDIKNLILIISENFKNVLLSKSKTGIIANLFFSIKIIEKVGKSCFFPEPKVDSYLIKLTKKDGRKEKILKNMIKKQGKIKNALIYSLVESGKTKNQARKIIKNLNINKQVLEKPVKKITSRFLIRLKEMLESI